MASEYNVFYCNMDTIKRTQFGQLRFLSLDSYRQI